MTLKKVYVVFISALLMIYGCEEKKKEAPEKPVRVKIERVAPKEQLHYMFVKPSVYFKQHTISNQQWRIINAVNRADSSHIVKMDSILVPSEFDADIAFYLPFPHTVAALDEIDKIIFFSYPAQAFGAYEYGQLVYTGPSNMGRKKDTTPTGLFFTNWKAEETTSTFDDEWQLKWNFNIENKLGVGWHEYEMPGYPASHSCLRLLENDAKYLYSWADQWKLHSSDSIEQKGTPVIVFGTYPFDGVKPWYELKNNPHALDIDADEIGKTIKPYLNEIMNVQRKRLGYE